jgi:hypothetical protein
MGGLKLTPTSPRDFAAFAALASPQGLCEDACPFQLDQVPKWFPTKFRFFCKG